MRFDKFKDFDTSYKFTKNNGNYYFNDEFGNEFLVEFKKINNKEVEAIYLTKDNDEWNYKEVETNIFKLTRTILSNILPDYLKNNNWINTVLMKGLSKKVEKDYISKRTKWYLRWLKNNPIEGWKVESFGNKIYLKKNKITN